MFNPPPLGTPFATGDLHHFPVPRLLFFLLKKEFLGTVTFSSPEVNGRVYFRDGMPVFTDIASTRDVLGRVLLERGVIDEPTFNRSLQELAQSGELQGHILLGMGAIDESALVDGLRRQLYRKLNRLFALVDAQVGVFTGEHGIGQQGEGAQVQADPLHVICQGVRNCFDASRMEPELDQLRGQLVRLRPGFERRQARYGMSDEENALAEFLGGQAISVESLLQTSHLSPLQTLMVVYTLWVTEVLSTTPQTGVDPGARDSRTAAGGPTGDTGPRAKAIPTPGRVEEGPPATPVARVAEPLRPRAEDGPPATPASRVARVAETPPPSMAAAPAASASPGVQVVPDVMDLARSFSTGMIKAVKTTNPPSPEPLSPILLGEEPHAPLIPPPPPSTLTPPTPDFEPIDVPPPLVMGAGPVITPPPPDELTGQFTIPGAPGPVIKPPPPDELTAPFIVPYQPEPAPGPVITPPPPDEPMAPLIMPDEPAPMLIVTSSSNEPYETPSSPLPREPLPRPKLSSSPGLPRLGSSTGQPAVAPSGQTPLRPAPAAPGTQAVMEHKSLLRRAQERMKGQDHFQVLEVKRDATVEQARDAYFRLAKLYHPDRCAALGLADLTPVAEEIFRHINEAHAVLADPTARKAYEEDLDGGGSKKKEALGALEAEFSFQKGVIFFRKKNYAEARRSFEEAWSLNDKEGEHLAWLAWTRYHDPRVDNKKELPRLKEQLLKALKISPQNPVCHYYLGEIYLALGDDKRARTCFARTVELQANHVEANRHLRLMQMRRDKQEQQEKKDRGLFGGLLKKK